jgi:hypothetical protein
MTGKESFFKAHWDWLVAVLGLAAVAVVFLLPMLVTSGDDAATDVQAQLSSAKPAHDGVEPADRQLLKQAFQKVRNPPSLSEVDAKKPNFLSSERRIFCRAEEGGDPKKACGRPIPAEATECPFCHTKQPALVKIEVDSDRDGLPNEWELQYGFNPNDAKDAMLDTDGDGFTNLEEYEAKTDPRDPKSHPDYLDFVSVRGTLKQTFLPFYFKQANPMPGNTFRLTFQRLDAKSKYDSTLTAKVGEPVKSQDGKYDSGYVAKNYSIKEMEVPAYKGSKMMKKAKVGFVDVERTKDGKKLTLREGVAKIPVETQLDITYDREGGKTFTIFTGAEFEIHGVKYKVKSLEAKNGKPVVTIQDMETKKQKILQGT